MSRLLQLNKGKQTIVKRVRADIDLDNFFLIFCYRSCACLLKGSVFTTRQQKWDSFAELTQNTCGHHLVVSRLQLFLFFFFYSASTHTAPTLEILSANQNPLPIYWWYLSIFFLPERPWLSLPRRGEPLSLAMKMIDY